MRNLKTKKHSFNLCWAICVSLFVATAQAQNDLGAKPGEIDQLKADLARQQKQLLELQKTVDGQQRLIEQLLRVSARSTTAEEGSTASSLQPNEADVSALAAQPEATSTELKRRPDVAPQEKEAPLAIRIGNVLVWDLICISR